MKKLLLVFSVSLLTVWSAASQNLKEGSWRGGIIYSDTEVPFTFEVEHSEDLTNPYIAIINGSDRALIKDAFIINDSLIIPMFAFDITLKAHLGENEMSGELIKHYRNRSYPFKAQFGLPRYDIEAEEKPLEIEPRWEMTLRYDRSNPSKVVGLFEQNGNKVTATLLTEVSDFRFFEGKIEGNTMELSSFDGVHAFLIKGTYQGDSWVGEIVYDDGYSENWKGSYNANAEIRDPFKIITLGKEEQRPDFKELTAEGQPDIEWGDYEGKVLLIQLFGTWCPNSWDQTKYLVDWYNTNQSKEVEVLAVNFEANYSKEYGERRIKEYKDKMEIGYDVILGGRLSKKEAAKAFPFMDRILAFPTLVIVDKKGYARHVHSFFTGPATGEYYYEFDQDLNAIVDKLLKES